jgi:RHS repeat-associated protein
MTGYGTASYVYDAENRLIATAGYSYIYDGDGQRVEKCTEGTTPGTCATGATGTLYWRGLGSDPLSETNLVGTVQNTYVFFGGQRVARRDSAGLIHYYFSDHLGSHGVVENATGTTCEQDIDYYPYGGVENDYCATAAQNYKFTGKERDAESGLDYFGARHDSSGLGRFMTPDDDTAQDQANPQSWNLYTYVLNQPTTKTDSDGHSVTICSNDQNGNQHCQTVDDDAYKAAQQADKNNIGPSLSSLQNSETGSGVITNAQGSPVGNVQWTPDNPGIQILGLAGAMGMAEFKAGVTQMAFDALGIGVGRLIGGGIEAARAAQMARAGEEAGAGVEGILAKAASSVGNQGIKAASREAAEQAAREWVGEGARAIRAGRGTGEIIGEISADGTKVARFTSVDKASPYINLENKVIGGNLHVSW